MKIAVYCGSTFGNDPEMMRLTQELGKMIAEGGHSLVYGGGKIGLMGVVSQAVLDGGGEVIGVIPEFLNGQDRRRDNCTHMTVTRSMAERKTLMEELADAYIALPGGAGTLEEISEVISLSKLNRHQKPCILFDIHEFYQPLKQMMDRMIEDDFLSKEDLRRVYFADSIEKIRKIINEYEKD